MIKSINVRFFVSAYKDGELDQFEVTERCFLDCFGSIEYTRHTMWANGVNQICLYKDSMCDWSEIETL